MNRKLTDFMGRIYIIAAICLQSYAQEENIALGKPATQLGTWDGLVAGLAVDGNTNQSIHVGSCAHPYSDAYSVAPAFKGTPAWWSVNLAGGEPMQRFFINNVTIYFRDDCCQDRIPGIRILVGDDPDVRKQRLCAQIKTNATVQTLPCHPERPYRYLSIRHQRSNVLTLCEVVVNGHKYKECDPGYFGEGCNATCNCKNITEICDSFDGFCQSGCALKYFGVNCSQHLPEMKSPPTAIRTTLASVTLEFPSSLPPADDYFVEYKTQETDFILGAKAKQIAVDRFQVNQMELFPHTRYAFRIVPFIHGNIRGIASNTIYHSTASLPEMTEVPREVSTTSTSVTVEFSPSVPPADSYRLDYRQSDLYTYEIGHTIEHTMGHRNGLLTITQDGLKPDTYYFIRIVPLVSLIAGIPSPHLRVHTKSVFPVPTTSTSAPEVWQGIGKAERIGIIVGAIGAVIVFVIITVIISISVSRSRKRNSLPTENTATITRETQTENVTQRTNDGTAYDGMGVMKLPLEEYGASAGPIRNVELPPPYTKNTYHDEKSSNRSSIVFDIKDDDSD